MPLGLIQSYSFIRDRFRSIRKDYQLQNEYILQKDNLLNTILNYEYMARFHIMSCHEMSEEKGFSLQQEHEQMWKCINYLQKH